MKIEKAVVENWRGIGKKEIVFSDGLNIVYGHNEAGKSTLMEAMYLAFTGDASSARKEYQSLVPWNTKVKAKVSLTFKDAQGQSFRVAKSFPKGSAGLWFVKDGEERLIAEDKETDPQLFRRLGIEEEQKGLFELLWVHQGDGAELLRNKGKAPDRPVTAAIKDIIRGKLLSPAAERLYAELQREREDIFTSRGLKTAAGSRGGEIDRLQQDYDRTVREEQDLRRRMAETEEKMRRHRQLVQDLRRLEDEAAVGDKRLKQLKAKQRVYAQWQRFESEAAPLEQALHTYRRKEGDRRKAAEQIGAHTRKLRDALDKEMEALRRRREELAARHGEIEQLQKELSSATVIEKARMDEAERWVTELNTTNARLESQLISLELTPYASLRLQVAEDEAPAQELALEEIRTFSVSRSLSLEKPGEFSISVTGPLSAPEFNRLKERRDQLRGQLQTLLQEGGAESIEELRERHNNQREKNTRLQSLKAAMSGGDLREMDERLEQMRQKRSEAEARLQKMSTGTAQDAEADALFAGEGPAASSSISSAELERRLASRESALAAAETAMKEALAGVRAADAKQLQSKVEEARRTADEKRGELEEMEPRDIEEVDDAAITRAERSQQDLQRSLMRHREEKAKIEGEIGGTEDYSEQLAEYEYRRRVLRDSLRREWSDVYALETILRLMGEEKEHLEERIYQPLEERIGKAFSQLTGQRYGTVHVQGELAGLEVNALTFDNTQLQVGLDELSYGTREQLSFLFRLSLAEALSEKQRQVMVLDDSFVNSDSGRLSWLLGETGAAAGRLQTILFTCTRLPAGALPPGARQIDIDHSKES